MVIIRPHITAVTLFRQNGEMRVFASINDAFSILGFSWIKKNVGKNFRVFSHVTELGGLECRREPVYRMHEYIMRDDCGEPLTIEDFNVLRIQRQEKRRFRRGALGRGDGAGLAPYIHKRKKGYYFRCIAFINAYRVAETFVEEGEVPPRPRRNAMNLPNNWDDYCVAARSNRNWKQFRRTQWK